MKPACLFIVFIIAQRSLHGEAGRLRRSLLNFNNLIRKVTGKDPLDFNGYGCYCGIGGHGKPVDFLDRCCQRHDQCYGSLQDRKICGRLGIYISSYKTVESPLACGTRGTRCGRDLCGCDLAAARCFTKYPFQPRYKKYNRKLC